MKSAPRGKRTFKAEITNISTHGFWILIPEGELFVAFDSFPLFRNAAIADVLGLERLGPDHLDWPALDVDLSIASIANPEAFPLLSRFPAKASR